ncbi:MAG: hypothetical protein Q8J78_07485 [Moraxellaceae bacterium]|nr:hypothetical protein [Moraxellaceae bacterium]
MSIRRILVVALVLVASARAQADEFVIRQIDGELTPYQISQALEVRNKWFRRAKNNCDSAPTSPCAITLRVAVPSMGGKASCSVLASTIQEKRLRDPYCAIAESVSFPAGEGPTTFFLDVPLFTPLPQGAAVGVGSQPLQLAVESVDDALSRASGRCKDIKTVRDAEAARNCFFVYGQGLDYLFQQVIGSMLDPEFSLRLSLKIDAEGNVAHLTSHVVSGAPPDPFVLAVEEFVKRMKFGKAPAEVEIEHTLNFFPG